MEINQVLLWCFGGTGVIIGVLGNMFIKAIEKRNAWKTKLFEDVYKAHKLLYEEIRVFKIDYNSLSLKGGIFEKVHLLYFLRSYKSANEAIIKYRDNLYPHSLFLNPLVKLQADYIKEYLNMMQTWITIKVNAMNCSLGNDQPEKDPTENNPEWLLFAKECTEVFEHDMTSTLNSVQNLIENQLRGGVLSHKWKKTKKSDQRLMSKAIKETLDESILQSKLKEEYGIVYDNPRFI